MSDRTHSPSRRRFLTLAAAGLATLVGACTRGSASTTTTTATPATAAGTSSPTATTARSGGLTGADFAPLAVCELTPEQSEGPFYLPGELLRRDITEGRPGSPLRVGLQVVDRDCSPIPSALVDVWHADVDGDYSAFVDGSSADEEGAGSIFLRGSQMTDTEGIAEFLTIYPGWYPGRTVHIHVKVHIGGSDVFTSQMYFPDTVTDEILAAAPYSRRGTRDTRNAEDFIAGGENVLAITETDTEAGPGKLGLMVLGVTA